jgi:superoxide reductase
MVNVKSAGEKYKCSICGNEVKVLKAGGGELVCCGKPMNLVK